MSDTTISTIGNQTNKLLVQIVSLLSGVAIIPAPTYGAVGTYVMAKATAAVAPGATIAGSSLIPSNAAGSTSGTALTGTWTAFCDISASGQVGLFVRSA